MAIKGFKTDRSKKRQFAATAKAARERKNKPTQPYLHCIFLTVLSIILSAGNDNAVKYQTETEGVKANAATAFADAGPMGAYNSNLPIGPTLALSIEQTRQTFRERQKLLCQDG